MTQMLFMLLNMTKVLADVTVVCKSNPDLQLIFGFWLMNLVINLKLKQKFLLMSTNVTQNGEFFQT